jgi:hypothetical protein
MARVAGSSWLKIFGFGLKKESKPDRQLYQEIRDLAPSQIVQLGLGDLALAKSLITEARQARGVEPVRFVGMDLFELNPEASQRVALRDAYRELRATGAEIQLIPGHPRETLPTYANHVRGMELAVLRCGALDAEAQDILWKYLPRTLAASAVVYLHREAGAGESPWVRYRVDELPQPVSRRAAGRRAA